jgi:hypothetical protein
MRKWGNRERVLRGAFFLLCVLQLALSISAIVAASLDNSMRDVGIAAVWSTVLLFANNILCWRYLVGRRGGSRQPPNQPFMFGFWLGFQAMLSPTFLVLALFFFSFSELFEDDDVHSAGGALGFFFLLLSIILSGFWLLVVLLREGDSTAPGTSAAELSMAEKGRWREERERRHWRSSLPEDGQQSSANAHLRERGKGGGGGNDDDDDAIAAGREKRHRRSRRKLRRPRGGTQAESSAYNQQHLLQEVRSSGAGWWH